MIVNLIPAVSNLPVFHCSPAKTIIAMILLGTWLWVSTWVDRDADKFSIPGVVFNAVNLAIALFGAVLLVYIPSFLIAVLIFVAAALLEFGTYVVYRNGKVNEAFRIFTPQWFAQMGGGTKVAKDFQIKVPLYESNGNPLIVTDEKSSNPLFVMGYSHTQDLLIDCVCKRAAEVALDPAGNGNTVVRYVIDGMTVEQPPLTTDEVKIIAQFIKQLADIDPKSSSKQNGKMGLQHAENKIEIEVTTAANKLGDVMRLKMLQEAVQMNVNLLGIPKRSLAALTEAMDSPGVIAVTGLPKTGTTSTLYSLLKTHDAFMKNLVTIERKPTAEINNITQNTYSSAEELNEVLAANLRHEPDVLMLDNIGNAQTIEMINEYAKEKTVLIHFAATDACEGAARWKALGGNPNVLKIVTCQFMMRKICDHCKTPYKPDPEILKKLRLPDSIKTFYSPAKPPADPRQKYKPCVACREIGYVGRTGVFEVLVVDDRIRDIIKAGGGTKEIREAAKTAKNLSLTEQAYVKVAQGVTSLEEAQRMLKTYSNLVQQIRGGKSK